MGIRKYFSGKSEAEAGEGKTLSFIFRCTLYNLNFWLMYRSSFKHLNQKGTRKCLEINIHTQSRCIYRFHKWSWNLEKKSFTRKILSLSSFFKLSWKRFHTPMNISSEKKGFLMKPFPRRINELRGWHNQLNAFSSYKRSEKKVNRILENRLKNPLPFSRWGGSWNFS